MTQGRERHARPRRRRRPAPAVRGPAGREAAGEDTIALIVGDEFIIVLADLAGADGGAAAADKLLDALREPFAVGGQGLRVTSSMDIALFPAVGAESSALQRRADEQMYVAKRLGRNGYAMTRAAPSGAAGAAAAGSPESGAELTDDLVEAILATVTPPGGSGEPSNPAGEGGVNSPQ